MIVLIWSKDASRKRLKDLVRYQDTIVYDCTTTDKYQGLDTQKKNSFAPSRKLWDEEASYEVFTTAKSKEDALNNFFTSIDFKNDAESLLDSYIRADGRINHIIIIRQMAYDNLKQYYKRFFENCMGGEDRNIFLLWEEIENNYQDALSWIPDDETIKWAKRAYENLEASIQQRKPRDKLSWDDEDEDEELGHISHKVSISGKEIDLDEMERDLAEREVKYARSRPTMWESIEKDFPALYPKLSDQLTDIIRKQKKKDKKMAKKMKKGKNFYTEKPNFPDARKTKSKKGKGVPGLLNGWPK